MHMENVTEFNNNDKSLSDSTPDDISSTETPPKTPFLKRHKTALLHLILWLFISAFLCTAYALQIPKGYNQDLLILGIVYTWVSLYLFFCYVPTIIITAPWNCFTKYIHCSLSRLSNESTRTIMYAVLVVSIIAATVFSFPEKPESSRLKRLVSFFGLLVFLSGTFLASVHRAHVPWNTVITAILIQFLLAIFVFKTGPGHDIFQWIADFAESYLHNAYYGTEFVFGTAAANANTFALNVFPAIIFFASTVQMLYYLGTIQWVLRKLAVVFIAVLEISGAEAIVAVASPFLGASENALLIEPLVPHLTKSEIHQILTSGFATISGSVLYGYIAMGISGQALLTSCIMSIPCSVAISKLRYPETENSLSKTSIDISSHKNEETANILHAAGIGAELGIKIVFLIMANIISILAILYAVNGFLIWLGNFVNIPELTLQLITGYIFVPIAWLIGADNSDLVIVGRLMATKIWSNEFIAYKDMTQLYMNELSERSKLVATYALCGFANFGSVGMQVGVLGALAPTRTGEISQLAISALICGSLSTWLSASIAGMMV